MVVLLIFDSCISTSKGGNPKKVVDGDNREENLRILCPNCHSQTETHSKRKSARVA